MASINFGPFGDNWFKKPPNPFTPINLLSVAKSLNPFKPQHKTPLKFASISTSTPFQPPKDKPQEKEEEEPGEYMKMLEQFYWESENRPDYRHTPEVEKILNEDDSIFEKKDNPTPEEVEENKKWWNEFRDSPVVQFLQQAHEIADKLNETELKENSSPYRGEDDKYWKAIPNVMGLDGRPMPRKAIKTDEESNDKFWDFTKQFFFGLWNFKQRPYPRGRPIDVAQAIGFKQLESRYYDCKFVFCFFLILNFL